jgi:2-amino-4-hydroxy-6-hydroxymethyldihydropteridine diphosphokinase
LNEETVSHKAWIGIGSNLGDRLSHLKSGLEGLMKIGKICGIGRLYETDPLDYENQGAFLNTAALLETEFSPADLLSRLKRIEADNGRISQFIDKGPRNLDLDILLFDDLCHREESLIIPHPSLTRRKFALLPLLDIDPGIRMPGSNKLLKSFLPEVESQGVYLMASSWYNA